MASTHAAIFIDSSNIDWRGGLGWIEYSEAQFMGGSTAWGRFNDSTWMAATFNGTRISYYGNGVELVPWNYTSIIDDGEPEYHAMTQEPGLEQVSFLWYNSPTLDEGSHLVNLTAITQGAAIDYAVIQPSPTQNLNGQVLIVDQNDPLIKYTGSWQESSDGYTRVPNRVVLPFNGTVHTTSRVGDFLQFPFTGKHADLFYGDQHSDEIEGSAVRVYGFFDWTVSGEFGLSFTIDGQLSETVRYPLFGFTSGRYTVEPNYLLYTKSIPAGDHVLTVNVTELSGGQKVIIDNIQYRAAFDTLATIPQVAIPDFTQPSVISSQPPTSAPSTPVISSKSELKVGAVVGGALGGAIGLALTIATAVLLCRRRHRAIQALPELYKPGPHIEPPYSEAFVSQSGSTTRLEWNGRSSVQVDTPPVKTQQHSDVILGPDTNMRDSRVEILERRVQELARQTEQLANPPPYR